MLRPSLMLALVALTTACVGPLAPLKPLAPLAKPLAPEPVCTSDTVENRTGVAPGQPAPQAARSECSIEVGGLRR